MKHAATAKDAVIGFAILVAFLFLGMGLNKVGVPLPGSVLGLLLFTFALSIQLVRLKWVEAAAMFLVRHMSLLFIPILAGVPGMSAEFRKNGVALLVSMVVSLLACMLTTGGFAHFLLREPAKIDPSEAND